MLNQFNKKVLTAEGLALVILAGVITWLMISNGHC